MHDLENASIAKDTTRPVSIVELRQYTLHPGMRDTLIELFDREFIKSQEALGMSVLGQFRDLDDPNRFVWLRGFSDMSARAPALEAFYRQGRAWKTHRAAANATMIDSDNVLLLRPARSDSGFAPSGTPRVPAGTRARSDGVITANIEYFDAPVSDAWLGWFERERAPQLTEAGATIRGTFVTEYGANEFPALPVREGVDVFVWFAGFPSAEAHAVYENSVAQSERWRAVRGEVGGFRLGVRSERLRLSPTARSLLRS